MTLSGMIEPTEAGSSTGAEIFAQQCSACHGENGMGDRNQGAPNLTDSVWLYGGTHDQISNSIWRGPYGVMPAWEGRLDEPTITALAAYVYLLGGGEPAAPTQTAAASDTQAGPADTGR
jgi:cytochrome c oxidase cbb3-type subunit 3